VGIDMFSNIYNRSLVWKSFIQSMEKI
jgi:hypothetical protein